MAGLPETMLKLGQSSRQNVSATFRFRNITPGIDVLKHGFSLPRHRHLSAYATVVLAGTLEEAGYAGRIQASAGDVLIHPRLDCHVNQKILGGVRIVRLTWSDPVIRSGLYHIDDIDRVAMEAEKSSVDARLLLGELLRKRLIKSPRTRNDWPDLLAFELAKDLSLRIGDWARTHQLAPETVSRGFLTAYGICPEVFKAESRARTAWLRITDGTDDLSAIAVDTGFADQAHMTRWIRRTTGAPPGAWRQRRAGVSAPISPNA
jgi:AraC-like DNA-binding protein